MFRTGSDSSSSGLRRALHKWGAAVMVVAGLAAGAVVISASARTPDSPAAMAPVALGSLPAEAQTTHELILQGGPFPYQKDGTVFGNREGVLPSRPRGYYTEYTVPTPGSRDRGARRIVAGGDPEKSGEYYYTSDHYRSFQRIRE